MSQKSQTYRYQKNTSASRVVSSSSNSNARNTKNDDDIPRCNKCGKYKYARTKKITTYETGTYTKKTQIDQKKRNTYSKTTTVPKRSSNLQGNLDLTPKVKVKLDPEKIRKAVEEQKRINEEQKRQKESRTHKVEERINRFSKEENYTYNRTTDRNILIKKKEKEKSEMKIFVIAEMKIVKKMKKKK